MAMIRRFEVATPAEGLIDITDQVAELAQFSGLAEGICHVFVQHTTAGITINENTDPAVTSDIMDGLNSMVPQISYQHVEGNSPAHIKSSLIGSSASVPIERGQLVLGTWQAIYLCEFDGPRHRTVCVTCVGR
jgi:secondary thiamine-phosphate synthase enzyme